MSCLVINIGNTNIRFGHFVEGQCENSWIINTKPFRTQDELYAQFKLFYKTYPVAVETVEKIIVGSVVPQLTLLIVGALQKIHGIKAVVVDRQTPSPIQHKSGQMGTDIYANLVAAHFLYSGKKKIILDFGTALTASCLDEMGEVLGVIIAPGIITSLNSLVQQTAQLPEIELTTPKAVLGHDTVSCMTSGMVYGFLGMVEGFIDRINKEVKDECFVIATGGVSHVYEPLTTKINVTDKLHTLKGLYYLGKNL